MTKSMKSDEVLSRRKALRRIGLFAATAYAVPALTTLSVAQAGSGASAPSANAAPSASASGPMGGGTGAGAGTGTTTPATPVDPAVIAAKCGPEDLTSVTYVQCVVDNGFPLPQGFVIPAGVVLPAGYVL